MPRVTDVYPERDILSEVDVVTQRVAEVRAERNFSLEAVRFDHRRCIERDVLGADADHASVAGTQSTVADRGNPAQGRVRAQSIVGGLVRLHHALYKVIDADEIRDETRERPFVQRL